MISINKLVGDIMRDDMDGYLNFLDGMVADHAYDHGVTTEEVLEWHTEMIARLRSIVAQHYRTA